MSRSNVLIVPHAGHGLRTTDLPASRSVQMTAL